MINSGVYLPRVVVEQRIASYMPRDAPPAWSHVGDEVRALVAKADPLVPYDAAELLSVLSRLALFCHGQGQPSRAWLEPSTIDWFLDVGCRHLSSGTRATYRSRLRRLREAIHGGEAPPIPLSASTAHQPYTAGEQAALWSFASNQPTDRLRRGARTLLALGLGVGLPSEEIIPLLAGQVRVISNGAVVVEVHGRRPRLVVCRHRWEPVLAELADTAGSEHLFLPGAVRGKNLITNFLGRAHRSPATPEIKISRLRDTWLVEHLTVGTPLTVIVAAAGLDGLGALDRLLPYLPVSSPEAAERQLRGER